MRHIVSLTAITEGAIEREETFVSLSNIAMALQPKVETVTLSVYAFDAESESEEPGEYFDENTLFKVMTALAAAGVSNTEAQMDVIRECLNAGILFRERRS